MGTLLLVKPSIQKVISQFIEVVDYFLHSYPKCLIQKCSEDWELYQRLVDIQEDLDNFIKRKKSTDLSFRCSELISKTMIIYSLPDSSILTSSSVWNDYVKALTYYVNYVYYFVLRVPYIEGL